MEHPSFWRDNRPQCRAASLRRRQEAAFDEFLMFTYKIATCPRNYSHDWLECPYAHSGESARRREPHTYKPIPCPESKGGQPCPRGDSCKFAHNDFEYWLHPIRFKTEYCKKGSICNRKVCFFAHKPEVLRVTPAMFPVIEGNPWGPDPARSQPLETALGNVQTTPERGAWDSPQRGVSAYPAAGQQAHQTNVRGCPGGMPRKDAAEVFHPKTTSDQPGPIRALAEHIGEPGISMVSPDVPPIATAPHPEALSERGGSASGYLSLLMGNPMGSEVDTKSRDTPKAKMHPTTAQPRMMLGSARGRAGLLHQNKMAVGDMDVGGEDAAYRLPLALAKPHLAPLGFLSPKELPKVNKHPRQEGWHDTLMTRPIAKHGSTHMGLEFLGLAGDRNQ